MKKEAELSCTFYQGNKIQQGTYLTATTVVWPNFVPVFDFSSYYFQIILLNVQEIVQ